MANNFDERLWCMLVVGETEEEKKPTKNVSKPLYRFNLHGVSGALDVVSLRQAQVRSSLYQQIEEVLAEA